MSCEVHGASEIRVNDPTLRSFYISVVSGVELVGNISNTSCGRRYPVTVHSTHLRCSLSDVGRCLTPPLEYITRPVAGVSDPIRANPPSWYRTITL